jgi:hypothetical protein
MDFKIMKIIVFGFLMTFSVLQSQNNLIYNEAKFVQIGNNNPVVVPDGKVWKIESYSNGVGANRAGTLNINGQDYVLTLDSPSNGVIWAPAGSSITGGPSSNTGSMSPINVINVIEFNVVPTSTGTGSGSGGVGVTSDGLVFSEVINQFIPTSSVTGAFGTVAGSFIVPEGKIWKIHNMTHNKISTSTGGFVSLNGSLYVSMDGIPIYGISTNNNVVSNTTANTILTPGTYELKWYQGSGAGGPYYSGTITHLVAIEYNIPQ